MTSTVGEFVPKGIILDCSSLETCLDLHLRMLSHTRTLQTKHTETHSPMIIIIIIIITITVDATMLPSWSEIVGAVIVVPFEGSVVAIAVGRFAAISMSVLEFVATVDKFLM